MTKEQYQQILISGKLFEHYPTCIGNWGHDEPIINYGEWFVETNKGQQSIYNLDRIDVNMICVFPNETLKAMVNNYSAQENYEFAKEINDYIIFRNSFSND